jgi:hypothetical protein
MEAEYAQPSKSPTTTMDQSSSKAKARKERAQLSCAFCRHRKLKCDRNQPCDQCVKRSQTCHFNTPVAARVSKPQQDNHGSTIQSRIRHLEGLVLSLMNNENSSNSYSNDSDTSCPALSRQLSPTSDESPSASSSSQDPEQALKSFGFMNVNGHQTKYVGNEHWQAILYDIEEVKAQFQEDSPATDNQATDADATYRGPELLSVFHDPVTRANIMSTIPPRPEVDALISDYLNSADPFTIMFHLPTFKLEYSKFWQDQQSAPLAWISILYSMLGISQATKLRAIDNTRDRVLELQEAINLYRRQAAKCLILSGYTNPRRYTIEALAMYLCTEWMRSPEVETGTWTVFAMTIRLATAMGYHRDPSHFPNISAFHGEMRRRVWGGVAQIDVLSSVQVGLPRMVRDATVDCKLAGNYNDADLHEDMVKLPPPRPDSEYTKVSYSIFKTRITFVLGKIVDEVGLIQSSSYDTIRHLDQQLLEASDAMPDSLRMKMPLAALAESPGVIMRRVNLQVVFLKSRCILHRKYLTAYRTNSQYAFSREASVSAAVQLLHIQVLLNAELAVGGRLSSDRWLLSALTTADFTLAAMIVCLDLDARIDGDSVVAWDNSDLELFELLEKCQTIWREWSKKEISAPKARIASDALSIMLAKIRRVKAQVEMQIQDRVFLGDTGMTSLVDEMRYTDLSTDSHECSQPETTLEQPWYIMDQAGQDPSQLPSGPKLDAINTWIDCPQDLPWAQWDEMFMPYNNSSSTAFVPNDQMWSIPTELQGCAVPEQMFDNSALDVIF